VCQQDQASEDTFSSSYYSSSQIRLKINDQEKRKIMSQGDDTGWGKCQNCVTYYNLDCDVIYERFDSFKSTI
jgi:hypothetical protein